jgi:hypothetical protein
VWGLIFGAPGAIAGLYGLHRLALRLEEAGHLYYLRKKPKGGGGNAFLAVQRIVEPGAGHVMIVGEEVKVDEEAGSPP